MSKITPNLPESDYHAQTGSETPLFSYSTAKTIINKTAYHAWLNHPLLDNQPQKPTDAMNMGTLIHNKLLGIGGEFVVIKADNYKTKVAQNAKKEAYEAGLVPVLEKEIGDIDGAMERVTNQIKELAPYFFEPHETELSVRWEMDNGVKCQSRWDWIQPESGRVIDVKSIATDNLTKLENHILKQGYDIQEAMYIQAAEKTWPEMAGRFTWEFLFIEKKPPYMVSIVETDSSMSWLGESKLKRAADKWAECLESDIWPGYGRQVISAPGWAVSREEGE